jgi:hypothetical protein
MLEFLRLTLACVHEFETQDRPVKYKEVSVCSVSQAAL